MDYDISNVLRRRETTTASSETTQAPAAPELSGRKDFLLLLVSDDSKVLETAAVIRADMDNACFKVCTFSSSAQCILEGKSLLLSDIYASSSAASMKKAAQALTGTEAVRYIKITDSGIKKIFRTLGDLELDIPERAEYRDGDTLLVLDPGVQKVSGDTLSKYLDHLNANKSPEYALAEKNRVICAVLDSFATQKNVEKGEALFSSLINSVETDISAVDYVSNEAALKQFVKSLGGAAVAASSVSQMK